LTGIFSKVDLKALGWDVEHIEHNEEIENQFSNIVRLKPKVLLIEVIRVNADFLSFLLLIKSHTALKKTKVVAIFGDRRESEEQSDIYSFGVDIGFVLGEDEDKFIGDIKFLLSQEGQDIFEYATAGNLFVPTEVSFLSKVSHLDKNTVYLESSLNLFENDLVEGGFNFKRLNLRYFKVQQKNSFLPRSYFSNTYELSIQFNPNSEDVSRDKLTNGVLYDRYLHKVRGKALLRNDPVLVFDRRVETFSDLIHELNVNNRFIKISDSVQDMAPQIKIFRPEIICYQMEEEKNTLSEEENLSFIGRASFTKLLATVKSIPNYNPYLVVFNDRSRSKAYRKAYGHDKIIVNKKDFDLEYLYMLLEEYQKANEPVKEQYFFRPPDKTTLFSVFDNIVITSLSENKINFIYNGVLNDYTTFRVFGALNIFVTVVPQQGNPIKKSGGLEYCGLVTNTDESDRMELRKLVNLLIQMNSSPENPLVLKSVKDLREDFLHLKLQELHDMREEQKKAIGS
jgi:hypothetical protein